MFFFTKVAPMSSVPRMRMVPVVGKMSPSNNLMVVVFPEPLGPR
jgi:hypothetical protein